MIFTLLAPVFGVISGVAFLGEPLSARLVLGGILTVTGIAIVILRRPKVATPEAELLRAPARSAPADASHPGPEPVPETASEIGAKGEKT